MKKNIFIATLFWVVQFSFAQEISVFSAGDISSSNAYGLTENEQILLDSKKRVDNIQRDIEVQKENMIGLRSVVEGTNSQISKLEARVADLEVKTTGRVSKYANKSVSVVTNNDINDIRRDISELKEQIRIINQKLGIYNEKKNEKITKNYNDKTYTRTIENKKITSTNKPKIIKESEKVKENNKKASKIVAFDDMNKEDIFKNAKKLFSEKKYEEAKTHYNYLINKNYKPAEVNFMLGEISYNQKSYSNAIQSYKKSIQIKDNASYIPTLLYHSGISLEKIGDKNNASKFFTVLKTQYPDSTQAKSLK